jgi:predicted PhzF superfamily epimerase YddE/YHI9
MKRRFRQVDVFTDTPYLGNPVAVVLDSDGLEPAEMQRVATWTNLSETTFVLPPTTPDANYRVRIFTPTVELPFAGHPTLGTCHAWLAEQADPTPDEVVQECAAGLIRVRRTAGRLAFAGPPLRRSGPVDDQLVQRVVEMVGIDRATVAAAEWVDNGPGFMALLLNHPDDVLAVRPGPGDDVNFGLVALYPSGSPIALEVRGFFPKDGMLVEDPVTGSLNAGLAQWLTSSGRVTTPYVASQGTALGRAGRVHVSADDDGTIWVGGGTVTCVEGEIELAT